MVDDKDKYIRELEGAISKFMAPLRNIPFPIAIKVISGFKVVPFRGKDKKDKELL